MIFRLEQVRGGISLIEDVPLAFLENARWSPYFHERLFPIWFRPVLSQCPGVKTKFEEVFHIFSNLNAKEQRFLIDAVRTSKAVAEICNDIQRQPTSKLDLLSAKLKEKVNNLYRFLFEQTISTKAFQKATGMSLKDHYDEFQKRNEVITCPFCGLETYSLPERRRADYDHYLSVSEYPWLAVNFDNLVPMGDDCNGKKNATNILYAVQGDKNSRRIVWYPYQDYEYSLTAKVIRNPSIKRPKASWQVQLTSADVDTQSRLDAWDNVFEVKKSIGAALTLFHKRFIEDLCLKNNLYGARLTTKKLREELEDYRVNKVGELNIEPYAIAKKAWAAHYILRATDSELAPIAYEISRLSKRPSPLNIN